MAWATRWIYGLADAHGDYGVFMVMQAVYNGQVAIARLLADERARRA